MPSVLSSSTTSTLLGWFDAGTSASTTCTGRQRPRRCSVRLRGAAEIHGARAGVESLGQEDGEGASAAQLTLERQLPPEQLRQLADDRKAEPRSSVAALRGAVELFERRE